MDGTTRRPVEGATHTSRLYAGTVLLIAAAVMRVAWQGDWSLVLLIVIGVLLVISSFGDEGRRHG